MNAWLVVIGMFGAGVFYYLGHRCGYMAAAKKYLLLQQKENEEMDKILQHYAHLGRDELLEQLHNHSSH